jgi:hypothetical protein
MYSRSHVVPKVDCPSSFSLDPLNKGSERNLPAGDGDRHGNPHSTFGYSHAKKPEGGDVPKLLRQ